MVWKISGWIFPSGQFFSQVDQVDSWQMKNLLKKKLLGQYTEVIQVLKIICTDVSSFDMRLPN